MADTNQIADAIEDVHFYFRFLEGIGCKGFDCSTQTIETIQSWGSLEKTVLDSLEKIRSDMGDCRRCKLCRGRKNIVFGAGNPRAKLVFIGEGPGYEEDKTGKPFVGAAGRLLTKIIQAMHLEREAVYICNIIKCRPPGNRNPEPDEIEACSPFLKRQLEAISPDFICALGTFAARQLLDTAEPISKLRGRFHIYNGINVMPTYHPAYLLRNPEKKRDVWEDMKCLIKAMDLG